MFRPSATLGTFLFFCSFFIDDVILQDVGTSDGTINLPSAASNPGKMYEFKKTDSSFNKVTITRAGSDTIEGATTTTLNTQGETVTLVSDGTSNWIVTKRHIPSGWVSYTPSITGFGSPTSLTFFYRRVGDSLEVSGSGVSGSATSAAATCPIPTGLAIDTAKVNDSNRVVGTWLRGQNYALTPYMTYLSGTTAVHFTVASPTFMPHQAMNGNNMIVNGEVFSVQFSVPISGWNN